MRPNHLRRNLKTALPKRLPLPRMPAAIRLRLRSHPRRPLVRRAPIALVPSSHRPLRAEKRLRRRARRHLLHGLRRPDLPPQPGGAAVDQRQGGDAEPEGRFRRRDAHLDEAEIGGREGAGGGRGVGGRAG